MRGTQRTLIMALRFRAGWAQNPVWYRKQILKIRARNWTGV